ncbi:hypothetical protein Clacol_005826 [Clathrus columnatus]|uniref:No apical meristem-associated C-terminal domain-containing protein n=1 Tax=Clathrus columnatus TaxID=1419009 RepID=A0AAV5AF37_9AGAM|nr:hypothetical protein Clacol_005826 [Clathrus columnatus]
MIDYKPKVSDLDKHWDSLKETGQGLVDEGQEDEIAEGSKLENIWCKKIHIYSYKISLEKIQQEFPWYKQMNNLMGKSPIFESINNSSIDRDTSHVCIRSHVISEAGDDDDVMSSKSGSECADDIKLSDVTNSHSTSPGLDSPLPIFSLESLPQSSSPSPEPVHSIVTPKISANKRATTVPAANSSKHKQPNIITKAGDILEQNHAMQEQLTKVQVQVQVACEQEKQKGKMRIREMELQAEKERLIIQHAHDFEMRKLELSAPHTSSYRAAGYLDPFLFQNIEKNL